MTHGQRRPGGLADLDDHSACLIAHNEDWRGVDAREGAVVGRATLGRQGDRSGHG